MKLEEEILLLAKSGPRVSRDMPAAREAAPEPIIHVSIGRVEVRASAPPAPQRAARNAAKMSIDDYVARKNAKGRR